MLGEWNGRRTERVLMMADQFRASGFPTKVSPNMDAWLKTHAFFVTAISGAIYLSRGDCLLLSKDEAVLRLMADGVSEGFAVVHALGLPVAPFPLKVLFCWLPKRFAVGYWHRFFASSMGDYVFGRHSRSASQEMRILGQDCKILIEKAGVKAPALNRLYDAIEAYATQAGH
jgi:ketopantoate reductase